MPTISELLSARRPQDDEPRLADAPVVSVLHQVGPAASVDQVFALVDAQRRLGLRAEVQTLAATTRAQTFPGRPDILHVHCASSASGDAGLAGRARVVVLAPRSTRLGPLSPGTHVIAETQQHAGALVRNGVPETSVHVVLPAVPADACRLAGREPSRGPGFVVGILAAQQPAGWVRAAVEALLPVVGRRPGAEIWLGGAAALAATADWTPSGAAPTATQATSLPTVHRMVSVAAAAVGRVDVVVCLDQSVMLPPPLLSAMQLRRPIVASRVGACREVLDNGVSALLVGPTDTAALVASVTRLVRRPVERATLGGAAAEVAALQHAPMRVAGRLAHLYEHMIAEADATQVA